MNIGNPFFKQIVDRHSRRVIRVDADRERAIVLCDAEGIARAERRAAARGAPLGAGAAIDVEKMLDEFKAGLRDEFGR